MDVAAGVAPVVLGADDAAAFGADVDALHDGKHLSSVPERKGRCIERSA